MAVQDLTPQLRTRLSRVERTVGWFVTIATLLLLAGFAYYVYDTAQRKGWFIPKVTYFTYVRDATGLHVGDPVYLMGFFVGQVVKIEAESPENYWARDNNYNVVLQFEIRRPYYGYVLSDSQTRISTGDFLGKRVLEVTRGTNGIPTVREENKRPTAILDKKSPKTAPAYLPLGSEEQLKKQAAGYWLEAAESPALSERMDRIANQIEHALPNILHLTNQLSLVLSNANQITTRVTALGDQLNPVITNVHAITALLTNGPGALGDWLMPTNLNRQLEKTLAATHSTISNANTNLMLVLSNLNRSLDNVADLTSNLNAQVQSNSNILSQISSVVVQSDTLMQGLKRHWLLRSAFREKRTNAPPPTAPPPVRKRF